MQAELIPFETSRPANPLYCHQEFLEKLDKWRSQPIGKRASLLLQRLAIDPARVHFKATRGDNQGWRRSRLGGSSGSHFYAWWAPRGAAPLGKGGSFQQTAEGSLFLRDIRHHDDHTRLLPQSFEDLYLPVSVSEIRHQEYGPAPWTAPQERFATAQNFVRVLKGHPGSGKTTALLHAADATGAAKVLYVTYSPDLATIAKQYFDRYCDKGRQFHVVTYTTFLRQLLQSDAAVSVERESRRRFRADLQPFVRSLGVWAEHQDALYDEMHAHLVGGALPAAGGRFVKSDRPRLAAEVYKDRRGRHLGLPAAGPVLDIASRLERDTGESLAGRYFPELELAWRAAVRLSAGNNGPGIAREFLEFDCIAIDECQDLSAIEAYVPVTLAAAIRAHKRRPAQFLLAGDEAQTVRPTDFEWAWMSDLLHSFLMTPQEFHLRSNLRSPRQIADIVNRVWDLYSEVDKKDRPSGSGYAEIDDDAADQIFYCTAAPGEELNNLLTDLAAREGLALIAMEDTIPAAVPEAIRPSILTVAEAKGLDFHTACLIDAGKMLDRVLSLERQRPKTADLESIRRRLAIDRLRVALSRPTDRLIWLDIQPKPETVDRTLEFLEPDFGFSLTPVLPGAVQTALAEEQLDLEERVQRCLHDARQYLTIRPEIAWSRAQQAVSLLGDAQSGHIWVTDEDLRNNAYRTLSEVCFRLAMSGVELPRELGSQNLLKQASRAARMGGTARLPALFGEIEALERTGGPTLLTLVENMVTDRKLMPEWVVQGISTRAQSWANTLERGAQDPQKAARLVAVLPQFYDLLGLADAEARKKNLSSHALEGLIKSKRHKEALQILESLPDRDHAAEAECHRGLGNPLSAAKLYVKLGKVPEAIECYRELADFDAVYPLIQTQKDHPAAASYLWLKRLRDVLEERPPEFIKVMTPAEQGLLLQILEQGLGVERKKPVAKKAATAKVQVDPGIRKKVELYLKEHPKLRYCDECLTTLTMVRSSKGVALAVRDIAKEKWMLRLRSSCSHCGKSKTCAGLFRM